ncbi:hypothetical protein ACP6NG_09420 [Brevibacterium casei]|uniref:hypothetical protein n=1 Tax=Brevibacterium casei TaxID=33889 RepID=UPI003F81DB99
MVLVVEADLDGLFGHIGAIGLADRGERSGRLRVLTRGLRADDALGIVEVLCLLHPVRLGHFAERLH